MTKPEALKRILKSHQISGDGDTYIVLIEREAVGRINTWPGRPERVKWHEERVTLTLRELQQLANKYLLPRNTKAGTV